MAKLMDYGRIMDEIEDLGGSAPGCLIHAPFADRRNLTPYARLNGQGDDAWPDLAGKHAALFGTPDKAETLGLIARAAMARPARLSIVWDNDDGGKSLPKLIKQLGWEGAQESACHARFASIATPPVTDLLARWITEAAPRSVAETPWTAQAGLFSYRGIDGASRLLLDHLPESLGEVVGDFGCGWGFLTQDILTRQSVKTLYAIDDDARAVACMTYNIQSDPRVKPVWADVLQVCLPEKLDSVIMNPPFHVAGVENRTLGIRFIEAASRALKKGGRLYLVANRHLPYERTLQDLFSSFTLLTDRQGFKVVAATL